MHELLLFRHADAEARSAHVSDFQRPLSDIGRAAAQSAARRLARMPWQPQRLLYSPAQRTAETAAILAAALELDGKRLQALPALYLATPDTLRAELKDHHGEAQRLLIVGHNPGLSEFGARLAARYAGQMLPTAAYWHITLDAADWQQRVLS